MVTRRFLIAVCLLPACSEPRRPPAAPPPAGTSVADTALAPKLALVGTAGPVPDLEAFCASPADDLNPRCTTVEAATIDFGEASPFLDARILVMLNDSADDANCAIALRTSAGWTLVEQTQHFCADPSYAHVASASVSLQDAGPGSRKVAVAQVRSSHYTKDGDDEGELEWFSICGLGATGPACTQQVVLRCEPYTCDGQEWSRTFELPGDGTVVVSTDSSDASAREGAGTFRLSF